MYIQTYQRIKCSKCGSINDNKDYWLGNTQYRECDSCGHKIVLAEITTSDSGTTSYNAINEIEIEY